MKHSTSAARNKLLVQQPLKSATKIRAGMRPIQILQVLNQKEQPIVLGLLLSLARLLIPI
jgi:hypothetical protein